MARQKFDMVFDRPGLICGTTDNGPIAMLIKRSKPGFLKMFSPDVTSHIALTVRWRDEYRDIIDANELKYDCEINYPDVQSGDLCLVEATWPRCRIVPLRHYRFERSVMAKHYVFVANPIDRRAVSDAEKDAFILSYVGKPYQLGIFGQMYGASGSDPKNKKAYCSEIADNYLDFIDSKVPENWKWGVPPVDIHLECAARGWIRWKCYKKNWW